MMGCYQPAVPGRRAKFRMARCQASDECQLPAIALQADGFATKRSAPRRNLLTGYLHANALRQRKDVSVRRGIVDDIYRTCMLR